MFEGCDQDHEDQPGGSSDHHQSDQKILEVLPGLKLPKTASEWEEANLYFKLNFDLSEPISNIDAYTSNIHKVIYDYFATNYYGTVSSSRNNESSWNDIYIYI